MRPIRATVEVPQDLQAVFDFLDVMANHEPFTDHMLTNWRYSGPPSGIGSRAQVTAIAGWRSEEVEIEVIAATPPHRIVERNIGAKGRRIATGTYELEP